MTKVFRLQITNTIVTVFIITTDLFEWLVMFVDLLLFVVRMVVKTICMYVCEQFLDRGWQFKHYILYKNYLNSHDWNILTIQSNPSEVKFGRSEQKPGFLIDLDPDFWHNPVVNSSSPTRVFICAVQNTSILNTVWTRIQGTLQPWSLAWRPPVSVWECLIWRTIRDSFVQFTRRFSPRNPLLGTFCEALISMISERKVSRQWCQHDELCLMW